MYAAIKKNVFAKVSFHAKHNLSFPFHWGLMCDVLIAEQKNKGKKKSYH